MDCETVLFEWNCYLHVCILRWLFQERIAQFDFDTGGAPAKVAEEESKAESELVGTSDEVQAIVDKILYYRGLLEKANKNSEKTEDVLGTHSRNGVPNMSSVLYACINVCKLS